jgi:hypothetical protein
MLVDDYANTLFFQQNLKITLRLVDSGKVSADEVCIFEMQGRVGGRAYSMRGLGPDSDLTVDPGGYRTVGTTTSSDY